MLGRFHLVIVALVVLALMGACAPATPTTVPTKPPVVATPTAVVKAPAGTTPVAVPPTPAPTVIPSLKVKRGGTLRDVERFVIDMLDPHLNRLRDVTIIPLMFDTLLAYRQVDPKTMQYEVQPGLAESYRVVDPTTLEFKLHKGVKFHDGTDLNAASVKWNLERAATHPKSAVKVTVEPIKELQVIDDYTFRLLLKGPSSSLPIQLTPAHASLVAMVSKDAVEKLGDEKFASSPVGTGPFKFKEWVRDQRVVLEKFPGHWEKGEDGQPLPYLDGFVMQNITDQSVALIELRTGNVDALRAFELKDLAGLRANPEMTVQAAPSWSGYPGLYFNPRKGTPYPFSNIQKLRQAAHYAVDRESMAKALGFGVALPGYYPMWAPGVPGYDETLPRYEFNLVKAKQLLAEAGYPDGIDVEDKVINRPLDVRPVEMLQGMWAQAGIRLKITALDRLPWLSDAGSGSFDALSHGISAAGDPALTRRTKTGVVLNYPGYSNPEMDRLWDQVDQEYDSAKRVQIYKQMQKIIYEDAYHLVGYTYPQMDAMNKKVKNLTSWWNYRYIWME